MQIFSECLNDIYVSVSEDDSSSEYSSASDCEYQTNKKKTLVIDSDTESENETHIAGVSAFAYIEEWTEGIS